MKYTELKDSKAAIAEFAAGLGDIGTGYVRTEAPTIWAIAHAHTSGDVKPLQAMYQDVVLSLGKADVRKWTGYVRKALPQLKSCEEDGFKTDADYATLDLAEGFEFSKAPAWWKDKAKTPTTKIYTVRDIQLAFARQESLLLALASKEKPRAADFTVEQLGYLQAITRRALADIQDVVDGKYMTAAEKEELAGALEESIKATGTDS